MTVHAAVRARRITFLEQPRPHVETTGDTDPQKSTSDTQRSGLPTPVGTGTYDDIRVEHTTAAHVSPNRRPNLPR
ncbi:hypothetical protein BJF85_12110 [Saccharomonospora sp. CUA-673]|nr:hypothetical protein BJF85_12110 [Saccharomonospora sp. CUA-673]